MLTLHLGVVDLPYAVPSKSRKKAARASQVTTGQVAQWLEEKYHVEETFYELHSQKIADDIAESLAGTMESIAMGAPTTIDPFGAATSQIQNDFVQFIENKEMERLGYPGVPTHAALMGVSHRFKHPYARRPPRPSFLDTGLFSASFRAWID